ncbi:MAG: amidohydrolase family protein [Acidobacteria bacterium]|nr:amidohydrolase family protein [Acidobacteriota bacterium]
MIRTLLTSVLFAVGLSARPPAAGVTVLRAARLFDGKSATLQSPGVVVIENGRIVSVGGTSTPAGARVIDLGDATLTPGFIDAHTHLTMESHNDWKQDFIDEFQKTDAEKALIASVYARKTLLAGFTTIRNLGAEGFIDIGLRNAIRDGRVPGPRMLTAGMSLGSTGGHCDPTGGLAPGLIPEPGFERGIMAPTSSRRAPRAVCFPWPTMSTRRN